MIIGIIIYVLFVAKFLVNTYKETNYKKQLIINTIITFALFVGYVINIREYIWIHFANLDESKWLFQKVGDIPKVINTSSIFLFIIVCFINSGLLLGIAKRKNKSRKYFIILLPITYILVTIESYRFLVLEKQELFEQAPALIYGFAIIYLILYGIIAIIYLLPFMKKFFIE